MKTTLKSTRLPDDLIQKVSEQAEAERRTFTNMLVVILADWAKKAKKTA